MGGPVKAVMAAYLASHRPTERRAVHLVGHALAQLMRRYGLDRAEARAEYGRLLAEVLAGQERTYDGQFRNRVQVPCQVTAAGGRQVPSLLVYDCQEQAIVTVFRRSNRLKRHRLEPKARRIA